MIAPIINLNIIVIKLILLYCIKYFVRVELKDIDVRYYICNAVMKFSKECKKKYTKKYFERYNGILYPIINSNQVLEVKNLINDFYELLKDEDMLNFSFQILENYK